MTPDTKKQLAQMGDITANKEKLRKAIEEAKKNPNDPRSVELRRRLERGMFNKELEALGKKPFPVQMPKIDMKAAMAGVKQEEGVQSVVPEKKDGFIMEPLKDLAGGLVKGGQEFMEGGQKIVETAMRPDRSLAEKATMIGGAAFKAGSGGVGELLLGGIKAIPGITPEIEQATADLVQKAVSGVAETELVQDYTRWYSSLDPRVRDQVDAVGGFASGLLDLIGLKTGEAGAKVIKEGLEASAPAIRQAGDVVTDIPRAVGEAVNDFITTSDATLERRIQDQFQRGVKPTIRGKENLGQVEQYKSKAATAVDVITKNKANLKYVDDTGVVVEGRTPESLKEFSEAISQTKEQIFKEYDNLAKTAGDRGLQIDVASLSNELDNVINDRALQLSNPEAVKYAESVKQRFATAGPLTAEEAQNVIKNYNNSLEAFYRNPTPEGLTRNAVDALMVNQVRKSLDEGIEGLTGQQYQTLKNQYGALRTIEKDVLNATLRDSRKNVAGLIDFTDILTGGQLVTSLASMNPAMAAGAVAQGGIKRWLKYLNDPNTQIKKMFKTSEKLNKRTGEVEYVSEAEQLALPPGQTDVPTTYGNTPIEVGGTDPLGRPIQPGGTERVAPDATINRTDSEPNVPPVKQIQDATDEATSQVETEMTELSRAGQRIPVLDRSGSIVGFKADPSTFPKWVPENLRTTDLFTRVWNNINAGRAPRANATNEAELQRILEAKIKERADQILSNPKKDVGIFDANAAFGLALVTAGSYYLMNEDGSVLPVMAVGMMNPTMRKQAVKQLDDMIADARKAANSADATPAQRRAYEKTVNQLTKQKAKVLEEPSFNKGGIPETTKNQKVN